MPDSQLLVDSKVNFTFIAADGRSTQHGGMNDSHAFKQRLDAAVKAAGFNGRGAFAEHLGAKAETSKQTAQQWVSRSKLPDKYRKPLEDMGLSLDWVNDNVGTLHIPRQSQDLREQGLIIRAAIALNDRIRDLAFGAIPEHLRERVEDEIANEIAARGPQAILDGTEIDGAAASVRTKVMSAG